MPLSEFASENVISAITANKKTRIPQLLQTFPMSFETVTDWSINAFANQYPKTKLDFAELNPPDL